MLGCYFFSHFSTFSNTYMLLYHTKNSSSLQYYDCLHYIDHTIQLSIIALNAMKVNDYNVISFKAATRMDNHGVFGTYRHLMFYDEVLELVNRYSIPKINSYAILRIKVHLLNFVNTNFMILFKTI